MPPNAITVYDWELQGLSYIADDGMTRNDRVRTTRTGHGAVAGKRSALDYRASPCRAPVGCLERSRFCRVIIICIVWTMFGVPAAYGQVGALPVDQLDSAGHRHSPALLGTPGELLADNELASAVGRDTINPASPAYLTDVLHAGTVARARLWLDSLAATPVRGLQLTPHGELAVVGEREALAQEEFAHRLGTPGLSVDDRAYTLSAAAIVFANRDHPQWLPIAERYLAQLTTLGIAGEGWQFTVREHLAEVYYDLDRRAQALAYATGAYALLPDLPFEDHFLAMNETLHLRVLDILLGTPAIAGGMAKMHAVDSLLVAMARPTQERMALDPSTAWLGQRMIAMVQTDSAFAVTLGQVGPPIAGSVWINTSDSRPHAEHVGGGRIYLLDFFRADDAGDLPIQIGLMRLQERLGRATQLVGITSLTGHWGLRFVDPPDESDRWQHFFMQSLKLTFPICLWIMPKERTESGGMLPPQNPNIAGYHLPGDMGVIVVDQFGRVRRLFTLGGRDEERDIARFVAALQAENGNVSRDSQP